MRKLHGWWLLVGLLSLAGASAIGQGYPDNSQPNRPRRGAEPDPQGLGLMLTPKLLNNLLDRAADGMVGHYGLDDDQLEQTRETFKSRIPTWIFENQARLQPLITEYLELTTDDFPPTPEQMSAWAARALPVAEEVRTLMRDTTDDMRNFLTDEQQVILNGEMAVFDVGVNHVQSRLQVWGEGGYDWQSEWPRSEEFRKRQKEDEQRLMAEGDTARNEAIRETLEASGQLDPNAPPAEKPAAPEGAAAAGGGATGEAKPPPKDAGAARPARAAAKDEWTEYVNNFIRRYKLDEGQQNQALKILHSLQEQRDKYLARRLPDIESLEKRGKAAKAPEEQEKVKAELAKINEPIDRYFKQLKSRLEQIPSRKQRTEAARSEMDTEAKAGEKGPKK